MNTYFLFPKYWALMNDSDRYQYNVMRAEMSAPSNKNQRNKRIETFSEALDKIKSFCLRGDESEDWKRCLVCGICWLPEGIAINTHQLRILIFKCKSSINGSLQKMGFTVNLGRTEAATAMVNSVPYLKENTSELRQWTVRKKDDDNINDSGNENDTSIDKKKGNIIIQITAEPKTEKEKGNEQEEVVSPPPTDLFVSNDVFLEIGNDIQEDSKNVGPKDDLLFDFWDTSSLFPGSWGCF